MNKLLKLFGTGLLVFSLFGCNNSETPSKSMNVESSEVVESKKDETDIIYVENKVIFNTTNNTVTPTSMQQAIAMVHDSVVTIDATTASGTGAGAGVLVGYSETESYIVTCHHVIDTAYELNVTLNNGDVHSATLIGGDFETDIAVITIPVVNLCYANVYNEKESVSLGSSVFAIGNPLGTLGGSVTSGIISATSREIVMNDGTVMNLMQTDAAINSGNSGGGLFNTNGELIGIVNAKYSATGVEGLGFAIPSNTAMNISKELIEKGYVTGRFNLGANIKDSINCVYVYQVDSDGCAYGLLKSNDIITKIEVKYQDGRETKEFVLTYLTYAQEVYDFLDSCDCKIGDTISFTVQRGRYQTTTLVVDVLLSQYVYQMPTAE